MEIYPKPPSITPAYSPDLPEPSLADQIGSLSGKSRHDVKVDYGAFGDGNSHPLSSKYGTLTAAQVDYPFATALTQEIDWCAFVKMFNYAMASNTIISYNNIRCFVPNGKYILKDPLPAIGNNASTPVPGNFVIEGESFHSVWLEFNFTDQNKHAMEFASNSGKWDISNICLEQQATGYVGYGFYFNNISRSSIKNIYCRSFKVGIYYNGIMTNFKNVTVTESVCGFYWDGSVNSITSTTIEASYMTVISAHGYADDFAGVGYYLNGSISYSKLVSCGSDGNDTGYKITGTGNSSLTLDTCGSETCNEPIYINNPNARIHLINPYWVNQNQAINLANVQNAEKVIIEGINNRNVSTVVRGTHIGVGVISIVGTNFNTKGGTASLPTENMPTYESGVRGINDFIYDGVKGTTTSARMINFVGNQLQFKLDHISGGMASALKITVLPWTSYLGQDLNVGGEVQIAAFAANTNTVYKGVNSTNANFSITATPIGTAGTNQTGFEFILNPLNGVTGTLTNNRILFIVEAFFYTTGTDENITTNRTALLLKGVDY